MDKTITLTWLQLADLFFNYDNDNIKKRFEASLDLKIAVEADVEIFLDTIGMKSDNELFGYLVNNFIDRI